ALPIYAVELVAARRPHLHVPQLALRVEGDAEHVAVAQRPDLRGHPALVGEGVARRRAAVVAQAQDLAHVRGHVLRGVELLPLARAEPQVALAIEQDAVAVVAAAADLGHLAPDHLQALEARGVAVLHQPGARERGAARVAPAGLGIAQVDQAVAGEIRVWLHVAHAAL